MSDNSDKIMEDKYTKPPDDKGGGLNQKITEKKPDANSIGFSDDNSKNETVYEFGSTTPATPTTPTTPTTKNSKKVDENLQSPSLQTPTGKDNRQSISLLSSQSTPNVQSLRGTTQFLGACDRIPGGGGGLSATNSTPTVQLISGAGTSQNPSFDSHVISERVKNLATQIYQELKRIISRCNYDEDVLGGLMPLIVRVLESLDLALIENQQLQVELELCKDDNEQLAVMFDKEKASKRALDKKLIEAEYAYEEERQQHQQKIESLENIVKMFELKAKNASDQAARLEEKEAERNIEYNKLHDRYSDLLKSHCDVMERVRHLLGNEASADLTSTSSTAVASSFVDHHHDSIVGQAQRSRHLIASSSKPSSMSGSNNSFIGGRGANHRPTSVWNDTTELTLEDASLVVIDDDDECDNKSQISSGGVTKNSGGLDSSDATLCINSSINVRSDQDYRDQSGDDKDSITYTSMEREFRKLIQENRDLLNTKNALNVVKDDLIAEVDRLSNVVSMYEQEIKQLNNTKDQLRQKTNSLESALRATKEELAKAQQKIKENDEEGVPYAQRKRFTRVEMAKVLMERNGYKEKLIELQDAVRYTESVRANRVETEKRSGLWKFFSNLFGAPPALGPAGSSGTLASGSSRNSSPISSVLGTNTNDGTIVTASDAMQNLRISGAGGSSSSSMMSKSLTMTMVAGSGATSAQLMAQRTSPNSDLILLMDADVASDRKRTSLSQQQQLNQQSLLFGMNDRVQAYGWSLPESVDSKETGATVSVDPLASARLNVPIPLYCRPMSGDSVGMKIWCATAIDFSGGSIKSQTMPVRKASSATSDNLPPKQNQFECNLSSFVWICSTQHSRSKITVIDVKNKPNNVLAVFYVPTFLYCIESVPGIKEKTDFSCSSWDQLIATIEHNNSGGYGPSKVREADNDGDGDVNVASVSGFGPSSVLTSACAVLGSASSAIGSASSTFGSALLPSMLTNQAVMLTNRNRTGRNVYKIVHVDAQTTDRLRERLARKRSSLAAATGGNNNFVKDQVSISQGKGVQKADEAHEDPLRSSDEVQSQQRIDQEQQKKVRNEDDEITRVLRANTTTSAGVETLRKLDEFVAHTLSPTNDDDKMTENNDQETSDTISPLLQQESNSSPITNKLATEKTVINNRISSALPTVWMGGKDRTLYIHSAMGQWHDCIACVELSDSILGICHFRGRAFVALANGCLCIFARHSLLSTNAPPSNVVKGENSHDTDNSASSAAPSAVADNDDDDDQKGQWNLEKYIELDIGQIYEDDVMLKHDQQQQQLPTRSGIRCLEIANSQLWLGYKNYIFILDPVGLRVRHSFQVIPQADNQVRQLVAMKDGVFCCLRSDLTLRVYSALDPYQHIQDVDIEPVISRLISPKTFVISRITALRAVDNRLWIGDAHGIILTIPCDWIEEASERREDSTSSPTHQKQQQQLTIARYIPHCDVANAQLSFHGHKDAVKFFVHTNNLLLSGGEGYFDFRLAIDDQYQRHHPGSGSSLSATSSLAATSSVNKSHLILWQLSKQF